MSRSESECLLFMEPWSDHYDVSEFNVFVEIKKETADRLVRRYYRKGPWNRLEEALKREYLLRAL